MKNWRKKNSRKKCFHSYYTVSEVVNFFLIHTFPKTENRSTRNLSTTPSRTPEKKKELTCDASVATCIYLYLPALRSRQRVGIFALRNSRGKVRAPRRRRRAHMYTRRADLDWLYNTRRQFYYMGSPLSLSLSLSRSLSLVRVYIYMYLHTCCARIIPGTSRAHALIRFADGIVWFLVCG